MARLTDAQWRVVERELSKPQKGNGGRPRVHNRRIFEGVLWVLFNGSKWSHLPDKYGSYVTCWRRFREWEDNGSWGKMWNAYIGKLNEQEKLKWTIAFLNGNFAPTKRGGGRS